MQAQLPQEAMHVLGWVQ